MDDMHQELINLCQAKMKTLITGCVQVTMGKEQFGFNPIGNKIMDRIYWCSRKHNGEEQEGRIDACEVCLDAVNTNDAGTKLFPYDSDEGECVYCGLRVNVTPRNYGADARARELKDLRRAKEQADRHIASLQQVREIAGQRLVECGGVLRVIKRELPELVDEIRKFRNTFQEYAQIHLGKPSTPENEQKVKRNSILAGDCCNVIDRAEALMELIKKVV